MNGSILLNRNILESQIFASEKRLKIWIWLLLKASYKKRFISVKIGNGESVIEIERSQLLFGRFKAEESLNIDGSTIYKALKQFEKDEMIKINSNSHYTIITICNYDTYQTLEKQQVTAIEQPRNSHVTAIEQPRNTYKKDNKVNKVNTSKINIPEFSEFKNYALQNQENTDLHKLELKYKSWIESGWIDGKGNKIKNWKSKLLNTLPFLQNNGTTKDTGANGLADAEFWKGRLKVSR